MLIWVFISSLIHIPFSVITASQNGNAKNYFCVSTDKAANPANMMGASKRIMEINLMNVNWAEIRKINGKISKITEGMFKRVRNIGSVIETL